MDPVKRSALLAFILTLAAVTVLRTHTRAPKHRSVPLHVDRPAVHVPEGPSRATFWHSPVDHQASRSHLPPYGYNNHDVMQGWQRTSANPVGYHPYQGHSSYDATQRHLELPYSLGGRFHSPQYDAWRKYFESTRLQQMSATGPMPGARLYNHQPAPDVKLIPGIERTSSGCQTCPPGYGCCSGLCVPTIKATIVYVADDTSEMYICGEKVGSSKNVNDKASISYEGPCGDIFIDVTNPFLQGGVDVAVIADGSTYASGLESLKGYSKSSNIPKDWYLDLPGFDYSGFTPVARFDVIPEGHEEYWNMFFDYNAYAVTDATDDRAYKMAFRFPHTFCKAIPPPSASPTPSSSASPTPAPSSSPTPSSSPSATPSPSPQKPAEPGEKCDATLEMPCTAGYACDCNGICAKKICSRIVYAANDGGKLYICGKLVATTSYWQEVADFLYHGSCSDLYLDITNPQGGGGASMTMFLGDGRMFSSGVGGNLTATSISSRDVPLEDGWQYGDPDYDYSAFTPVVRQENMESIWPYSAMIYQLDAYPVTDATDYKAKYIGMRFSAPFCFE